VSHRPPCLLPWGRPRAWVGAMASQGTSEPPPRSLLSFLAMSRSASAQGLAAEHGRQQRLLAAGAPPLACHVRLLNRQGEAPHSSCPRCLGVLAKGRRAAGPMLRCGACGEYMHGSCAYPPVPDRACCSEGGGLRGGVEWICETCLQEQALLAQEGGASASADTGRYPFCTVCGGGDSGPSTSDLRACAACRGSYHLACKERCEGSAASACPDCSGRNGEGCVHLVQWSLELQAQRSGRLVPLVRGVRSDGKGPPGSLWRTSEIVHAVTPTVLITRTHLVVRLAGPLSAPLARELKVPPSLVRHFRSGFPVKTWMPLVRYAGRTPPPRLLSALEATLPPPLPRKGARRQAASKRLLTGRAWAPADVATLHRALRSVRPSTPHFWQQVAARVGRPAEECQERAFGAAAASSSRPLKRRRRFAAVAGAATASAGQDVPLASLDNVPRKDGPRRAQRLRAFLNARSFGAGRDFLQVPPPAELAAPVALVVTTVAPAASEGVEQGTSAPAVEGGQAPSPGSLKFFASLHTGCTPDAKSRQGAAAVGGARRQLFAASPGGGDDDDLASEGDGTGDGAADGLANSVLLDLGDCTWQPKGLDGFICDARARRGTLARIGSTGASSLPAACRPRAAELAARADLRRAPALFRQADKRAAALAALESTPRSGDSESEDEMAPVAIVPPFSP